VLIGSFEPYQAGNTEAIDEDVKQKDQSLQGLPWLGG
jgi:hypothetical protein